MKVEVAYPDGKIVDFDKVYGIRRHSEIPNKVRLDGVGMLELSEGVIIKVYSNYGKLIKTIEYLPQ